MDYEACYKNMYTLVAIMLVNNKSEPKEPRELLAEWDRLRDLPCAKGS